MSNKHPVVRAVELPFKAVDHLIHGKKRHQAAAAVQARARGKAARERVVRQQAQARSCSERFFGDCPTGCAHNRALAVGALPALSLPILTPETPRRRSWWKAPVMCLFFIAVLYGSGWTEEWLSHVEAPPLPPSPPPFPPSPPSPPAMPFTPMFVTTSAIRGRMYDAAAGAAALIVALVKKTPERRDRPLRPRGLASFRATSRREPRARDTPFYRCAASSVTRPNHSRSAPTSSE